MSVAAEGLPLTREELAGLEVHKTKVSTRERVGKLLSYAALTLYCLNIQ